MKIKFSTEYNRMDNKDIFVEGIIETPTQRIVSKTYAEHQRKAIALMEGSMAGEFGGNFRVVKSNLGQDIILHGMAHA